jgi:hypothetical protein
MVSISGAMRKTAITVLLAAATAAAAAPAHAADCNLKILASVETVRGAGDGILVPVTIGGTKKNLLLDTGGYISEITPQVADAQGLERKNMGLFQYNAWGHPATQRAKVQSFVLGNLSADKADFMIGTAPSGIDGVLAPNLLRGYDDELDFARNKLTLISPDHCRGQVVYWPHSAFAAVPMRVTETGRVVFPVSLDGTRLQAMLDTSAARTTISAAAARMNFGIQTLTGAHRFRSLSVGGVTVNNPEIAISSNILRVPLRAPAGLPGADIGRHAPELLIGMSTLRHLHLYIAYNEQMLYFTAGEGAPAHPSGR